MIPPDLLGKKGWDTQLTDLLRRNRVVLPIGSVWSGKLFDILAVVTPVEVFRLTIPLVDAVRAGS